MSADALPPIVDLSAAMVTNALHPLSVEVIIDPVTLDRFFVVNFEEHKPITLRVSCVELTVILSNLAAAATRSLN